MSGFQARSKLGSKLGQGLAKYLLAIPPLVRVDIGAEFQFPPSFHEPLRKLDSPTALWLRYMPDSALLDTTSGLAYLVEFKAMVTPLHSTRRLHMLRERSGHGDLASANVGVVETAALENYHRLTQAGLKVALIVYAAFHPQRLLAEWEDRLVPLHSDRVRYGSSRASYTPYTNLHLGHMRLLDRFLLDEHPSVSATAVAAGVKLCLQMLEGAG